MKNKAQLLVQSIIAIVLGLITPQIMYWAGLIMGIAIGIMAVSVMFEYTITTKDKKKDEK